MSDAYWKENNQYHEREKTQFPDRTELWQRIHAFADVKKLFEVGCGVGNNLSALRNMYGMATRGVDINAMAAEEACRRGHVVMTGSFPECMEPQKWWEKRFDAVLSMGFLIHMSMHRLMPAIKMMKSLALKWVIIGEYIQPEWGVYFDGFVMKGPFDELFQLPIRQAFTWEEKMPWWDKDTPSSEKIDIRVMEVSGDR